MAHQGTGEKGRVTITFLPICCKRKINLFVYYSEYIPFYFFGSKRGCIKKQLTLLSVFVLEETNQYLKLGKPLKLNRGIAFSTKEIFVICCWFCCL